MRAALILLVLAGFSGTAFSQQRPAWLEMAIAAEAVDPPALRKAAGDVEEQKRHVAAIELTWLRRDAEAIAALRASADTAKELAFRLDALNMLTGVYMRAGDYALAAAVSRESQALAPSRSGTKPELLVAAEALTDTPPMTLSGKTQGALPLKMGKDGIPRGRFEINGVAQEAVFDTGATFSVVSQSVARQAGVRALNTSLRFAPGGGAEASGGLGVADELVIAEAKFRNVVVLILPDKDMGVLGETGAIVGLPVFLKMGRISMLPEGAGMTLAFGPSGGQPGEKSNMRLHKLNLILSGTLEGAQPRPVNMLLDTGASVTGFYARFAASFPDLVASAPTSSSTSAVIGETSLSRQARLLSELRLDAGGAFAITGAYVHDDDRPAYHGVLGQDVLRRGFTADFEAMTFELAL
jgi:predicted aspartyl protease